MPFRLTVCICFLALVPTQEVHANECSDRVEPTRAPELPKSKIASDALRKEACAIEVAFSYSDDTGLVIESSTALVERCKPFEKAAAEFIKSSKVEPGTSFGGCLNKVVFAARDDD